MSAPLVAPARGAAAGWRAARARLPAAGMMLFFLLIIELEAGELGSAPLALFFTGFALNEYCDEVLPERGGPRRLVMGLGMGALLVTLLPAAMYLAHLPVPWQVVRLAGWLPLAGVAGVGLALRPPRRKARQWLGLTFVAGSLVALQTLSAQSSSTVFMLVWVAMAGEVAYAYVDAAYEGRRVAGASLEALAVSVAASLVGGLLWPYLPRPLGAYVPIALAVAASAAGALGVLALAHVRTRYEAKLVLNGLVTRTAHAALGAWALNHLL